MFPYFGGGGGLKYLFLNIYMEREESRAADALHTPRALILRFLVGSSYYCRYTCNVGYFFPSSTPSVPMNIQVQMDHNGVDLYTGLPLLSAWLEHHSLSATEQYVRLTLALCPELEKQCSPINAFVYPKLCKAYDDSDRLCQTT